MGPILRREGKNTKREDTIRQVGRRSALDRIREGTPAARLPEKVLECTVCLVLLVQYNTSCVCVACKYSDPAYCVLRTGQNIPPGTRALLVQVPPN